MSRAARASYEVSGTKYDATRKGKRLILKETGHDSTTCPLCESRNDIAGECKQQPRTNLERHLLTHFNAKEHVIAGQAPETTTYKQTRGEG